MDVKNSLTRPFIEGIIHPTTSSTFLERYHHLISGNCSNIENIENFSYNLYSRCYTINFFKSSKGERKTNGKKKLYILYVYLSLRFSKQMHFSRIETPGIIISPRHRIAMVCHSYSTALCIPPFYSSEVETSLLAGELISPTTIYTFLVLRMHSTIIL